MVLKFLKVGETSKGAGLVKFVDYYGQQCSLQDSSLGEGAVWFGVDNTGPHLEGPGGKFNESVNLRMHLTIDQVAELIPFLQEFVSEGISIIGPSRPGIPPRTN